LRPLNVEGKVKRWSAYETSIMLDYYIEHVREVGPCKEFRNKKELFTAIASKLEEELHGGKDWLNVANKFKHIMELKKKQVSGKRTSGAAGGQTIQFQEQLDIIASLDDSIHPEVMMGVEKDQVIRKNCEKGKKEKFACPAIKSRFTNFQIKRKDNPPAANRLQKEIMHFWRWSSTPTRCSRLP
jgi:hypothetical protein